MAKREACITEFFAPKRVRTDGDALDPIEDATSMESVDRAEPGGSIDPIDPGTHHQPEPAALSDPIEPGTPPATLPARPKPARRAKRSRRRQARAAQAIGALADLTVSRVGLEVPYQAGGAPVSALAFDHLGALLASGGRDGFLRVYDMDEYCELERVSANRHDGKPRERRSLAAEEEMPPLQVIGTGHDVSSLRWDPLNPEHLVVAFSFHPDVHVYDLELWSTDPTVVCQAQPRSFAGSPSPQGLEVCEEGILCGDQRGSVRCWSRGGAQEWAWRPRKPSACIALAARGHRLYVALAGGSVTVLDIAALNTPSFGAAASPTCLSTLHCGRSIQSMLVSHDDQLMVVEASHSLRRYRVRGGEAPPAPYGDWVMSSASVVGSGTKAEAAAEEEEEEQGEGEAEAARPLPRSQLSWRNILTVDNVAPPDESPGLAMRPCAGELLQSSPDVWARRSADGRTVELLDLLCKPPRAAAEFPCYASPGKRLRLPGRAKVLSSAPLGEEQTLLETSSDLRPYLASGANCEHAVYVGGRRHLVVGLVEVDRLLLQPPLTEAVGASVKLEAELAVDYSVVAGSAPERAPPLPSMLLWKLPRGEHVTAFACSPSPQGGSVVVATRGGHVRVLTGRFEA